MNTSLRAALRAATRDLHADAERAGAMGALLRGELPLDGYRRLLANLLGLYEALEAALEAQREHPLLRELDCAALARVPALRADLAALGAPMRADLAALGAPLRADLAAPGTPRADLAAPLRRSDWVDATLAYRERLAGLAPPRLAAHAYVRYLGDLSGGQLLARQVARCYATAPTAFYDFGPPAAAAALRRAFVDALERAPADAAAADEARTAFALHIRLFEQLAPLTRRAAP